MSADQEDRVGFYKGNQLWKIGIANLRAKRGYAGPEELLVKCAGYFEWLEENQLEEAKLVSFEGSSRVAMLPKMRSPTLAGLCLYLGIHRDQWGSWRRGDDRPDLHAVVEVIEQAMYESKFTGAAAGLLNPALVARSLGLAERSELTGKDGGPIQTLGLIDEDKLRNEARRLGIPLSAFGISGSEEEGL